jgi:type I restriction enzyme S subunit
VSRGWPTTTLGEICSISSRTVEDFDGERPYYATAAVDADGKLAQPVPVTFAKRPSRAGCMPRAGDIGFARMKETKKIVRVDESLDGALFSTGFCFLAPGPEIDPRFLYYFISSEDFQTAKEHAAGDGIMGGIKNADVAALPIALPPTSEQQRIVAALDAASVDLTTAQQNTLENHKNAQVLFQSQIHALLNQSGDDWMERRLPEVAREFGRGKSKHRPRNDPKLYGGPYPFIQTGDVSRADHWLTEHTQAYSELGLAQSRLWPRGTVCIAIVGATVGESAILDFQACFPDSVIGIVVDDEKADREYVEYLLQAFKATLKEKGKGTARDNINLGTFETQTFPFPPLAAQQDIVARLNALREQTVALADIYSDRLNELQVLRESLLHHAFAGELSGVPR